MRGNCLSLRERIRQAKGADRLFELDAEDVALVPELGDEAPEQVREVLPLAQREVDRLLLVAEPEGAAGLPCGRAGGTQGKGERKFNILEGLARCTKQGMQV